MKNLQDNIGGKFTAFSYTPNLLLLGTNLGEILQLELPSRKAKYFDLDGIVLSLDCNYGSTIWAAGTDLGVLFIKKTHSRFGKRTYSDFGEGHEIRQVRFYKEFSLAVNTIEKVELLFLRDLKLGFDCQRVTIINEGKVNYTQLNEQDEGIAMLNNIPNQDPSAQQKPKIDKNLMRDIIQILTMPVKKNKNETLLIVASLDMLKFIIIRGQAEEVIEASTILRPDSVERGWIPTVSWMIPENQSRRCVIVYWKNLVIMIKNDGYDYMICGHNVLAKNYVWGAVLANRIVCMVDEKYSMRLETFENLFSNSSTDSKKQVFGGEIQLPQELINNCRTVCVREDGEISRTS